MNQKPQLVPNTENINLDPSNSQSVFSPGLFHFTCSLVLETEKTPICWFTSLLLLEVAGAWLEPEFVVQIPIQVYLQSGRNSTA